MFQAAPSLKQTAPPHPQSHLSAGLNLLTRSTGEAFHRSEVRERWKEQLQSIRLKQSQLTNSYFGKLCCLCVSSPARVMLSPFMFSIFFEWCIALFRWCSLCPPNHYLVQSGTGLHPYHSRSFINQKKKKKEFRGEGDMQEWLDVQKNLMLSVSNWFSPNLSVAARSLKDISHIL